MKLKYSSLAVAILLSFQPTVVNQAFATTGQSIYINGAQNETASAQIRNAPNGSTIILQNNVEISRGDGAFLLNNNIIIDGQNKYTLRLDGFSALSIGSDVTFKDITLALNPPSTLNSAFTNIHTGNEAKNALIFLNGNRLTLDNVKTNVENANVKTRPVVIMGTMDDQSTNAGNAELNIVNSTTETKLNGVLVSTNRQEDLDKPVSINVDANASIDNISLGSGDNAKPYTGAVNIHSFSKNVKNFAPTEGRTDDVTIKLTDVRLSGNGVLGIDKAKKLVLEGSTSININDLEIERLELKDTASVKLVEKILGAEDSSPVSVNVETVFIEGENSKIIIDNDNSGLDMIGFTGPGVLTLEFSPEVARKFTYQLDESEYRVIKNEGVDSVIYKFKRKERETEAGNVTEEPVLNPPAETKPDTTPETTPENPSTEANPVNPPVADESNASGDNINNEPSQPTDTPTQPTTEEPVLNPPAETNSETTSETTEENPSTETNSENPPVNADESHSSGDNINNEPSQPTDTPTSPAEVVQPVVPEPQPVQPVVVIKPSQEPLLNGTISQQLLRQLQSQNRGIFNKFQCVNSKGENVWVLVDSSQGQHRSVGKQPTFEDTRREVSIGAEKALSEHSCDRIGFAVTYAGSKFDVSALGRANAKTWQIFGYASNQFGNVVTNSHLGFGGSSIDSQHNFADKKAEAKYKAAIFQLGTSVGYKIDFGNSVLTPQLEVNFGSISNKAYVEKAGDESIFVNKSSHRSLMLNANAYYNTQLTDNLSIRLKAGVGKDMLKPKAVVYSQKDSAAGRFVSDSQRVVFNAGLGLNYKITESTQVELGYSLEKAKNFQSHQGNLKVGFSF